MARDLTASFITELTADTCRPFFLFELETISTTLRYSSLNFDVTWNSNTWLGNGFFKKPGDLREGGGDIGADGITVELSGEPSALISTALTDVAQNKPATLYLGFLDASDAVIADPYELYTGILDKVEIQDSPDVCTIVCYIENGLIDLKRSSGLRYNHESQQTIFAGDKGLEFVDQMQNWSGYWGKPQRIKNKKKKRR